MTQIAFFYLVLITSAEALTTLWDPYAGIIFHSLILITLLFHGAISRQMIRRRFLLALTLAPLIRILSISLPLAGFPLTFWYIGIGSLLFVATYFTARVTQMKANRLGFRVRSWKTELSIALIGPLLGFLEFFILRPNPLIDRLSWSTFWLPALSLLIFTGLLEELIFRGLIQESATESLGRLGLIYSAVLFAILHMGYLSLVDVLFVLGVGLMFGLIVSRTRSLIGVSLAHGLTNISMYLLYPFLLANTTITYSSPSMPPELLVPPDSLPHFVGRYSVATPTTQALPLPPPPFPGPSPTMLHPATPTTQTDSVPREHPLQEDPRIVEPSDTPESIGCSHTANTADLPPLCTGKFTYLQPPSLSPYNTP